MLTVYGQHFPIRQTITVNFMQNTSSSYLTTTTSNGQGSFLASVTVPATAALGPASVRACAGSTCAYATFTVLA